MLILLMPAVLVALFLYLLGTEERPSDDLHPWQGEFLIAVAVVGAGLWSFGMRSYQRERILSFVSQESDPLGAGYQLRQSKIAVGSGQLAAVSHEHQTRERPEFRFRFPVFFIPVPV